jgi:hypothetical protein
VWWPLRGSFVPGFDLRKEAHSVRGTVWEREGLKETRPLWPPQRGVGLQEPNLGKTNLRVSLAYSLGICFAPSLADSFIFLTLTRLVVVFIFINFSFALFTPPLGDYHRTHVQNVRDTYGVCYSWRFQWLSLKTTQCLGGPVRYSRRVCWDEATSWRARDRQMKNLGVGLFCHG